MYYPHSEDVIGNEGTLEDDVIDGVSGPGGLSFFCIIPLTFREGDALRQAVDLKVIKMRSTILSGEASQTGSSTIWREFHDNFAERDVHCVLPGLSQVSRNAYVIR
jgi:hypothetical protein